MAEFKDYSSFDIDDYLVARGSILNEYKTQDALSVDQEFEGVPGGNIIFGGMQIRKKKYADTTAGIWIGVDSDGVAKANLGDGTNSLNWSGTALNITGAVNATSGTIGGWTISATALTGSGAGILETAASGYRLKMSGADNAYQFLNGSTLLAELVAEITPNSGTAGATLRHPTDNAWMSISGNASNGWAEIAGSGGYFAVWSDLVSSYVLSNIDVHLIDGAVLTLEETGTGSNYIQIQAPAALSANYTLTLPTNDGSSGQFLTTDGSGVLSWSTSSGGATTALDNLASVAINTSLVSDTASTDNLGSSSIPWNNLYVDEIFLTNNAGTIYYNGNIAWDFFATRLELGSAYTSIRPAGAADLGSALQAWQTIYCNEVDLNGGDLVETDRVEGTSGNIDFNISGRVQVSTHFDPPDGGTYNTGGSSRYWGDVSYKTLTDRGCLGWYDDGVEMRDGRILTDLEALKEIKKHPTLTTPAGAPRLDYTTLPKHVYVVPKRHDGTLLPKDENGNYYDEEIDKDTGRLKRYVAQEGAETTALISILLGAIKELDIKNNELKSEVDILKEKVK